MIFKRLTIYLEIKMVKEKGIKRLSRTFSLAKNCPPGVEKHHVDNHNAFIIIFRSVQDLNRSFWHYQLKKIII